MQSPCDIYEFRFFYLRGARDDGASTPSNLHVYWNGGNIYNEVNSQVHGYVVHTFSVTATGTSSTIEFDSRNDPWFDALDDVSVESTVAININNTLSDDDNIVVFNPDSTGEGITQTIPAQIVNNSNATETIELSANNPSGSGGGATINPSTVTLPAGQSTDVTITPTADSAVANDVQIVASVGGIQVGADSLTIASVTFGTTQGTNSLDVRNIDTPTSMMQDRIPPTSELTAVTPVYVSVSPDLMGSNQSVSLSVMGQSSASGMVNINGQNMIDITYSGTVDLDGIDQTDITGSVDANGNIVGNIGQNAGNLLLTVVAHGVTALQSHGFSVAAIPIGYIETFKSPIDATHPDPRDTFSQTYNTRGFDVTVVPISDSGSPTDLGGIYISEQVQYLVID